jgi:NAD(P)-dependent dehydrogenase (short-subunit alcohol dehydrogenase family)
MDRMAESPKRILVTGANKGIGRATVSTILAARDDTFVLLGSRDAGRGDAAKAALIAEHPGWADRIEVLPIDVSDDASVTAAAASVRARHGQSGPALYAIVNNAGIGFAGQSMKTVLNVNARGPRRVCEAFMPLLDPVGRLVNVASASGPMFVSGCSPERREQLTSKAVTWADIEAIMAECLAIDESGGDFDAAGFGGGDAYGLSKACLNAYTIELARAHPGRTINACTPGFIETDMTRPMADARGANPKDLGMRSPAEGTRATMHLLFDDVGGTGWFFGSDAERSPLDRYRSPGDPPYRGD